MLPNPWTALRTRLLREDFAMNMERAIANVFGLDDERWARHANPWSGWTRMLLGLPLLCLAIWSRVWLDWWAIVPIAAVGLWLFLNPRMHSPAKDDRSWISKAVFGERLWTQRADTAIPNHHHAPVRLLNGISALGALFVVWGLVALDLQILLFGSVVSWGAKAWFLDRMTWIYRDVVRQDPSLRYRRVP